LAVNALKEVHGVVANWLLKPLLKKYYFILQVFEHLKYKTIILNLILNVSELLELPLSLKQTALILPHLNFIY
jgi:hypothetical protein